MSNRRNDLVQEDSPALPGRRRLLGAGLAVAAASLLPRNIARAEENAEQPPTG